jgi:putative ABC transport system permease protein
MKSATALATAINVKAQGTRARRVHAGLLDFARVALDSLGANKLRSSLTLLGIIISIASILSVISVIEGLDRYWKQKVSNFEPNTFVITQYQITMEMDKVAEMLRRNPEVRLEHAEAIRSGCSACEEVAVEVHKEVRVRSARLSLDQVDLVGVSPGAFRIDSCDVESGRLLLDWEDARSRTVALLGWEVAEKLFAGVEPIGQRFQIEGHWYTVIGVAEKMGTVFGFSRDNFIKIPLSTFRKNFGSRRSVNITIKAREGRLQEAQDQARVVMRAEHRLGYHDEDNFGLVTSEGVNDLFNMLTRMLFSVSLVVVGISLVVGGIVIMNIMLVSVVERTREIGIRKAVGARHRDVVKQFLIESVALCCAGGAGGVALGYLISFCVATYTPLPSSFPPWGPAIALAISSVVGIFFGIYPAWRAGRLDPIEALRAE